MKKLLLHLLKIIGIIFFLMLILDRAYNYAYEQGVVRSKLQKVLSMNENDQYDYIFLGSSRTENTIDCELVEKLTGTSCINLGISGSSLEDSKILLQLLAHKGVQYQNIFVQVDYTYNGSGLTSFLKAHLIPFKNDPVIRSVIKKEDDGFLILNVPFYGYLKYDKVVGFREVFNQLTRNSTNINYENGFSPIEGEGKQLFGSLPETIAKENKALQQMDQLLREQGLQLNYFIAPYCSKVENRIFVQKLEEKLPALRNYVSLFDNNEEYFANCGHINASGAQKFTEVLIDDFIEIGEDGGSL